VCKRIELKIVFKIEFTGLLPMKPAGERLCEHSEISTYATIFRPQRPGETLKAEVCNPPSLLS